MSVVSVNPNTGEMPTTPRLPTPVPLTLSSAPSPVMAPLSPLLVEPALVSRVWGGQQLARWLPCGQTCPPRLGEVWLDYDANVVKSGALAGYTLAQIAEHHGEKLVGLHAMQRYGATFPLLTKLIDAREYLSIQVHPDDAYATTREAATGFLGKTEAWYILYAEPGAEIIYGMNRACTREEFLAAVQAERLMPMLNRVPVQTGDMIFVPAGVPHAIGAGIVLYEIQQRSDLTYRIYDYGRVDPATGQQRALHLDKALDVINLTPAPCARTRPMQLEAGSVNRKLLVACPYFALEQWTVGSERILATRPVSLEIISVVGGQGSLVWSGGSLGLRQGDSVVLPASLGAWALRPTAAPLRLMRGYVPDLERDIILPLRAQGASDARIAEVMPGVV